MTLDTLRMVSPTGWGARVDYDTKTWRPWNPDKWVLHWPGGADIAAHDPGLETESLRRHETFHLDRRGWLGIAYNYAIGNSGTIYRLRGENRAGATSGDHEPDGIPENHEARAVLFLAGDGDPVSNAAKSAFHRMWKTEPMPVIGHKDVKGGTRCPGPVLDSFIQTKGYEMPAPPDSWAAAAWAKAKAAGVINDTHDPHDNNVTLQRFMVFLDRTGAFDDTPTGPHTHTATVTLG